MFINIGDDRTNVPARTEEGKKGIIFPTTGNTEYPFTQQGCLTCSKRISHGNPCAQIGMSIPFGKTRHEDIPATEHSPATFLNKLQTALYVTHYIVNGIERGTLFNLGAGTANNISQQQRYKINSVSSNVINVTGRDPRIIKSPLSITNPNWPLEAPIELKPIDVTDEQWDDMKFGRLIPSGIFHCLPIGAAVVFEFNSILFDKVEPYIVKINPPSGIPEDVDNVTFTIELSSNVSNVLADYDTAYPSTDKYCTIYFYSVAPESWANYQTPLETQYVFNKMEFDLAALTSASKQPLLKNTSGDDTRVLENNLTVEIKREDGDDWEVVTAPIITTDDPETKLDLTSFTPLFAAKAKYLCLATSSDTNLYPERKTCYNDQVDYSASYKDGTTRRCMDISCAKYQNGDYLEGNCWKTADADKFSLTSSDKFPIADAGDSNLLSRLWNRTSYVFEQLLTGVSSARNFYFRRPNQGGPSIIELTGSYSDGVPQGLYVSKTAWFSPRFGQRYEYEDDDGNEYQDIVYGFYEPRTYITEDDSIVDIGFDSHSEEYITGWLSRDDYSAQALDPVNRNFNKYGPSSRSLYDFELGSNGVMKPKLLSAAVNQVFSVSNNKTVINDEQNDAIQGVI